MDFRRRTGTKYDFSDDGGLGNSYGQTKDTWVDSGLSSRQKFAIWVALFGSVGGFLYGYDVAVISGALPKITTEFQLSTFQQELIVSFMTFGCLLGALSGGYLCDWLGRLQCLRIVTFLFLTGSLTLSYAWEVRILYIGRIIVGMAVSVSAIVGVTYLTEISPIEYRGAVVSANELMITVGLLVAYIVDYSYINDPSGWRWMFFAPIPVTILWLLSMFFMPESPRWLLIHGKTDVALKIYKKITGNLSDANQECRQALSEIESASGDVNGTSMSLWTDWKLPTVLAIVLAVMTQFTGNACVLSYAQEIFSRVGMRAQSSALSTIVIGITKVTVTLLTLPLIDQIGRRLLLLTGVTGMSVSLLVLSVTCYVDGDARSVHASYISLVALCSYVASFSMGFGPIGWLVSSEMFCDELRSSALGLVSISNWCGNLVVSASFLSLVELVGMSGAFFVYTFSCFLSFLMILVVIPETMGKQPLTILKELHARLDIPVTDGITQKIRAETESDAMDLSKPYSI